MRISLPGHRTPALSADPGIYPSFGPTPWPQFKLRRQMIVLVGLAMGLGLLIAANLQSKPKVPVTPEEYPRQIAADTVQRLEAEQTDLKRQISDLRRRVAERQEQAVAAQAALGGVKATLEDEKVSAGMAALRGTGLRVVLDDSAIQSIPAGEDPSYYIVHEYQLRDVVNILWSSRAEAIAINGERLVATSSIYCVGSTILVNNTRLSAPYEISAIGDQKSMEEALTNPNNLRALKTRVKVYGLQLKAARQADLTVPAYSGSLVVKYAAVKE